MPIRAGQSFVFSRPAGLRRHGPALVVVALCAALAPAQSLNDAVAEAVSNVKIGPARVGISIVDLSTVS